MKCHIALSAVFYALLVDAQTPAGANPSTNEPLGLNFSSTIITPNGLLIPQTLADAGSPTVYSCSGYPGIYTIAMVDLSIPYTSVVTTEYSNLIPGLGANRTTRLHWWLDNVTQCSDGTFDGTDVLAPFEGPSPPAGDEAHNYVMYLFDRPSDFTPLANAQAFYDGSTYNGDDRMNFSVTALAAQIGNPIAARYIQVQKGNNGNMKSGNGNATYAAIDDSAPTSSSPNSTSSNSTCTPSLTASPSAYYSNGDEKRFFSWTALALGTGAAILVLC